MLELHWVASKCHCWSEKGWGQRVLTADPMPGAFVSPMCQFVGKALVGWLAGWAGGISPATRWGGQAGWACLAESLHHSLRTVSLPTGMSLWAQITCKQAMISGPAWATTAVGQPGEWGTRGNQIYEGPGWGISLCSPEMQWSPDHQSLLRILLHFPKCFSHLWASLTLMASPEWIRGRSACAPFTGMETAREWSCDLARPHSWEIWRPGLESCWRGQVLFFEVPKQWLPNGSRFRVCC